MIGGIQADQSISFQSMEKKLAQFVDIIRHDPAVENVVGFTGGGQTNAGFVFVVLKPLSERKVSVMQVIGRLAPQTQPGRRRTAVSARRCRISGPAADRPMHNTNIPCRATTPRRSIEWAPKVEAALQKMPLITEVNLDQQQKGLESDLVIDRDTAARLGLNVSEIDNTLYDAFGQRQVSVIYAAQNQYHVVMEVAPQYLAEPANAQGHLCQHQRRHGQRHEIEQCARRHNRRAEIDQNRRQPSPPRKSPAIRRAIKRTIRWPIPGTARPRPARAVSTAAETMVPLSAIAHYETGNTPLAVNHQSLFVASTISFNLAPGVSLSQAQRAIDEAIRRLDMPATVRGSFQGTAKVFQQSLGQRADPDRRGLARRLYRARHSL